MIQILLHQDSGQIERTLKRKISDFSVDPKLIKEKKRSSNEGAKSESSSAKANSSSLERHSRRHRSRSPASASDSSGKTSSSSSKKICRKTSREESSKSSPTENQLKRRSSGEKSPSSDQRDLKRNKSRVGRLLFSLSMKRRQTCAFTTVRRGDSGRPDMWGE